MTAMQTVCCYYFYFQFWTRSTAYQCNYQLTRPGVRESCKLYVFTISTFSSGQEVQRISVITNLPDLLRDSHADCMRRVVPKVRVGITVPSHMYNHMPQSYVQSSSMGLRIAGSGGIVPCFLLCLLQHGIRDQLSICMSICHHPT